MPQRYGNAHANIVPYESFVTANGRIALAIGTDDQFRRFCEAADRHDLWQDERFQTNAGRVQYREQLIPLLQELMLSQETEQWLEMLLAIKIPAGPINDIPTALNDPQIRHRDMVQEIDHPTAGTIKQLGPVAKLSQTPAAIRSAPPLLGADTDDVLRSLGYTGKEIEQLAADGVV